MSRSFVIPSAIVPVIDGPRPTRFVVEQSMENTAEPGTAVVLIGPDRRVHTVVAVGGGGSPDAVLEVGEAMCYACLGSFIESVVLVSFRPAHAVADDDIDRWFELSQRFDDAALQLLEWFVVTNGRWHGVNAAMGGPSRWRPRQPSALAAAVR
jgi:hypothetical protein